MKQCCPTATILTIIYLLLDGGATYRQFQRTYQANGWNYVRPIGFGNGFLDGGGGVRSTNDLVEATGVVFCEPRAGCCWRYWRVYIRREGLVLKVGSSSTSRIHLVPTPT